MKKFIILLVSMLFFVSCGNKEELVIASKPMSENIIMAEIIGQLVEEKLDYGVKYVHGVGGGTSNIQPAMEKGDVDLYVDYTNTGWMLTLKNERYEGNLEEFSEALSKGYNEKFDFDWIEAFGFNDTYAVVVTKQYAEDNNLKTISDLEVLKDDAVFGAEYDFYEISGGYEDFTKEYGFRFKNTKDVDIGLKYDALKNNKLDIMIAFTTDGMLSKYTKNDFVILEDDLKFFPDYYTGVVVRNDSLEKFTGLRQVIESLQNSISEEEMQELNYKVDAENQDPKFVAETFLKEKGFTK